MKASTLPLRPTDRILIIMLTLIIPKLLIKISQWHFMEMQNAPLNGFCIFLVNFICRKNEEYRKKGCESSCDKLFSKPCFDEEKFPGCYCKPGLIRDDETDECFPIEQCSERICKEPNTKLYLEWKISFCTGPGTSRTFIYNKTILPICFCKEGFALKFDVCVPISKCM